MDRDVAIIGGSAAGFLTGHLLARRGFQVRLFEASHQLDHKKRTLIVTHQLRDILGTLGKGAVVNEIHRFELFSDSRVVTVGLEKPDLVVERSALIRELADEAQASGMKLQLGRKFTELKGADTGIHFTVEDLTKGRTETESAHIIVGSDGAFSKVAQCAKLHRQPTVPLMQAIVNLPEDLDPDTTRIWFIPDDTPYFYWLIPESSNLGVLGVIGEDGKKMYQRLLHFLAWKGLKPIEFQGAQVPCYTRWLPIHRKFRSGDVFLVGDAAGHVKVTTIGGTVSGLRGAIAVAEAISNGGSSPSLASLRRELNLHLLLRKVLHGWTQKDYTGLLELLGENSVRLLGTLNRDEAFKLLRGLLVSEPRLLLLALRSLLMGPRFPDSYPQRENRENGK